MPWPLDANLQEGVQGWAGLFVLFYFLCLVVLAILAGPLAGLGRS
jgi:hypothetical protein